MLMSVLILTLDSWRWLASKIADAMKSILTMLLILRINYMLLGNHVVYLTVYSLRTKDFLISLLTTICKLTKTALGVVSLYGDIPFAASLE